MKKPKHKKKKPKASIPANVYEKALVYLDKVAPFTRCYICDRESRNNIMVGKTHFRCESCEPMSVNWVEFWRARPKARQPESIQFLLQYCEVRQCDE